MLTSASLSLWRAVKAEGADMMAGNTNEGEGGSVSHGSHYIVASAFMCTVQAADHLPQCVLEED